VKGEGRRKGIRNHYFGTLFNIKRLIVIGLTELYH
jgi:hypothetical protein